MSFRIGDRVTVDRSMYPDFTETFMVTGIEYSVHGRKLYAVRAVGEPGSFGTVFYADELFPAESSAAKLVRKAVGLRFE